MVPQLLILIILKFIESIEDSDSSLEVMNTNVLSNNMIKIWFEVLLPKLMLILSVEVVL